MREIELIERRKPYEKHFLRQDGLICAKIYNEPIHYLKNNRYEEIDNSLVKKNRNIVNKNNTFKVEFNDDYKKSLVKVSKDDYFLDFKIIELESLILNTSKRQLLSDSNSVNSLINNDISISYQVLLNKIKETIVLNNSNCSRFSFEIDTNMELEEKNGIVNACDKDGKLIFRIEEPFVVDSKDRKNNNIKTLLKKDKDKYILDIQLDEKWLNDENTVYPVYLDPTISNLSTDINLYDTYIYPGDTNDVRYQDSFLKVGVERINNTDVINRALIKFDLPTLGTGDEIVYACLNLNAYITTSLDNLYYATMHRVTQDWSESTANWSTMNDKYDSHVESMFYRSPGSVQYLTTNSYGNYYDGNITNLVKSWYKNVPNYGIMIKAYNESYDNNDYLMLCSKDNSYTGSINPMPVAEIYYKNMNGLESYWDYKTQSLTNNNSYINTYNGNMVTIFDVGHTIGGSLPASLKLVYNTNDVILANNTKFGNGYKLNYEQKIQEVSINNTNYLSYLDEDGTTHYFLFDNNENIYKDEDGLNLTIKKEETQCILSDDSGNKMTFTKNGDIYYLIKIEDIDNNQINISLNQDNSISSITDSFNNSISINYGSNVVITNPDSVTTLYYTNSILSSVQTIKGNTSITYNTNGLIETISDVSGQKLEYEYYSNSPYKVRKVSQYGINNTSGKYSVFDYGFNTTTITDNKGRNNILIFNDNGNLLSTNIMSDTLDLDSAYSICNDYSNESNLKNKMTSSSIPIKTISNLLTNTSFEENTISFIGDNNISLLISDDYSYSGANSLKCISNSNNASFYQNISLTKGEYYTFSSYVKSGVDYNIELSYEKSNTTITETIICNSSNDFSREDISIYYSDDSTSDLKIRFIMKSTGTMYLDDIQLEIGEIANSYNPIENYDFRNGYSGWTLTEIGNENPVISDYVSVANISTNKTALKIQPNLDKTILLEKEYPLFGNEGDLYTFSFWYKNEGIPGYGAVCGINVMIYFEPLDPEESGHCVPISEDLNVNNNLWQYFSYRSHAMEDYSKVRLVISLAKETNDFYITNLSFNKELTSGDYSYDEDGNLISITDQSNNSNTFTYDSKNQLTGMNDSLGKNIKYEYDKNKKDRVINAMTSDGISNKTIYDSQGNPIISRTTKNGISTVSTGLYKIRSAGTNKYLKAELNLVLLEENDCSNTIWRLEESNNLFKIINKVNSNYNIVYDNDRVYLNTINSNNTFELERKNNGSYYIKYNDSSSGSGKVLTVNSNNELEFIHYSEVDSNAEFYLELQTDLFLENSSKYDSNNRFVESTIDTGLRKTNYNYNSVNGLLTSVINPKQQQTDYTYNNKNQCTRVKQDDIQIDYTYDSNNRLSKITQGDKDFNISYDSFNNVSSINLNNVYTFTSNTYENNNGNLLSTTYGNNNSIYFGYDYFDRVNSLTKMDKTYNYYYDNNGNLSKIKANGLLKKYYYDKANRLYMYKNNELVIKNTYDSENNLTNANYSLDTNSNNIVNTYDDYKLLSTTIDNTTINYSYDNLNRNIGKTIGNIINTSHSFLTNGKRSSNIIDEYTINNNCYKYYYDELFNITDVYLNNNIIKHYEYDDYNELVSEINYDDNTKVDYSYDLSGNLIQKVIKNQTNNAIIKTYNYSYNNSNWEDQLTTFDGNTISYDSIGNMTQYNTASFTWVNGNELSTYTDNTNSLNITYEYDDSGIRTRKVVNNVETKYYTINSNIIYELKNNNLISYLYDSDGLVGFDYNNNRYYYIKNMHDDIIGIMNSNGVQILTYEYDSWGKLLSIKDQNNNTISLTDYTNIANINPFRYRSYYYDVETGLYYLNHRYYNPDMGRFISPDMTLGSNKDILSCNLYAYVSNNPINNIDETGMGLLKAIKKVVKKVVKKVKKTAKKVINTVKTNISIAVSAAKVVGNAVVKGVTSVFNTLYNISEAINNSVVIDVQGGFNINSEKYMIDSNAMYGIEYSQQTLQSYNGANIDINAKYKETGFGYNYDIKKYESSGLVNSSCVYIEKQHVLVEKDIDSDKMFVGLSLNSKDYADIGVFASGKIGFNIDISWLNYINNIGS